MGEVDAIGLAGGGVGGHGAGGAVAGAEDVGADDEVFVGVERFVRAEDGGPPGVQAGVTGEGVADDQDVVFGFVEAPEGVVADFDVFHRGAVFRDELFRDVGLAGGVHYTIFVFQQDFPGSGRCNRCGCGGGGSGSHAS